MLPRSIEEKLNVAERLAAGDVYHKSACEAPTKVCVNSVAGSPARLTSPARGDFLAVSELPRALAPTPRYVGDDAGTAAAADGGTDGGTQSRPAKSYQVGCGCSEAAGALPLALLALLVHSKRSVRNTRASNAAIRHARRAARHVR